MSISRRDFIKLIGAETGYFLFDPKLRHLVSLAEAAVKQKEEWVYSICEYCAWRCGTRIKVADGLVKKIEGNPDHPFNYGKICAKGNAIIKQVYDPDRLKYPLIRAGSRGENKWKRASWDEALDYSAQKLLEIKKKYGPEAVLFTYSHMLTGGLYHNLAYGFGSPNLITNLSLCAISRIIAEKVTYGTPLFLHPGLDIKNCKYIIILGHNILESLENIHTQWLIEALSNGAKMVYVDPRFTVTSSKARRWLPIKAGTDLALLLSLN
ncbi:MAG: molybdopterin-dependent oxidoreductase [bacterium]